MNSQNGISSVAVWLFRLLRIVTSEAAQISAEQEDAGDLDRKLQQPARPRRDEGLELLHPDLPALGA